MVPEESCPSEDEFCVRVSPSPSNFQKKTENVLKVRIMKEIAVRVWQRFKTKIIFFQKLLVYLFHFWIRIWSRQWLITLQFSGKCWKPSEIAKIVQIHEFFLSYELYRICRWAWIQFCVCVPVLLVCFCMIIEDTGFNDVSLKLE